MSRVRVERCAVCAGPLEGTAGAVVVRCAYCRAENRLVAVEQEQAQARVDRLTAAADEARRLATEVAARAEELRASFDRAMERAMLGDDAEAGAAALRHLEGWMRLEYAPTLHMYRAMPPDDPAVVAALAQIDDAIDRALATTAQQLGVPYRSVRERLSAPR